MNKDKKFYRIKYKELRIQLSQKEVSNLSDKIFSLIKQMPLWEKNTFHLFISSKHKKEVETNKILSYLYSLNKIVATSKILSNRDLVHLRINKQTRYIENKFNILEPDSSEEVLPSELDVIFIPLLCFDKQGNRVGYGGGYYDKFLSKTNKKSLKIGLSFFEPVDQIEGIHNIDITLDICVTPEKVYNFKPD